MCSENTILYLLELHKWIFDDRSLYFVAPHHSEVLGTSFSVFKVYGSLMNIYLCSQCLYPVSSSYTSGIKAYSLQIKFTCYIGSTGTCLSQWMISFLSTDRDKCLWLNVLFSQLMNLWLSNIRMSHLLFSVIVTFSTHVQILIGCTGICVNFICIWLNKNNIHSFMNVALKFICRKFYLSYSRVQNKSCNPGWSYSCHHYPRSMNRDYNAIFFW